MLNKKILKKITAMTLILSLSTHFVQATEPINVFMPLQLEIPLSTLRPISTPMSIYVSSNDIFELNPNLSRPSSDLVRRIAEHRDALLELRNNLRNEAIFLISDIQRDLMRDYIDLFVLPVVADENQLAFVLQEDFVNYIYITINGIIQEVMSIRTLIFFYEFTIESQYENLINIIDAYLGIYDIIQDLIKSGRQLKPTADDVLKERCQNLNYQEILNAYL